MSIAEKLAQQQKQISIAEFFEKNRHILGFDSLQKALIMAVKEAVDNTLDACEDARILPEIRIILKTVGKNEYYLAIEDNGPGIARKEITKIFGRFLYGSKFNTLRQTRGQQGIGISAIVLYAQLTTGKPVTITSKIEESDIAYKIKMYIDTKTNTGTIVAEDAVIVNKAHGLKIELYLKGKYVRGKQSILEYLKNTAIVNPYAKIQFTDPENRTIIYDRVIDYMPTPAKGIKPHPYGLELGEILKLAKNTQYKKLHQFITGEFSKVSNKIALKLCQQARLDPNLDPKKLRLSDAKRLLAAFMNTRLMPPSTEALAPIGETLIKKGLKNVLGMYRPRFYSIPVSRKPAVFRGNVFVVEAGLVFGGDLPKSDQISVIRYANKVPLLYQAGACAITKAIMRIDWRKYGLDQRGGRGMPIGPAILLVHVASTKIPFTSEAKEAIAEVPEIMSEIQNAVREVGRQIRTFLIKHERKKKLSEKFYLVQKILPQLAEKSANILHRPPVPLAPIITKIMNVVWVDESIEVNGQSVKIKLNVSNFTAKRRTFKIYADITLGTIVESSVVNGSVDKVKDFIVWDLDLQSTEQVTMQFMLTNVTEQYKETNYYVENINPSEVIGAEPLPGDWNIEELKLKIDE